MKRLLYTLWMAFLISTQLNGETEMKKSQACSAVLMVAPHDFAFNPENAESNPYQKVLENSGDIQEKAMAEFSAYVSLLRKHGILVHVIENLPCIGTPDAVFPNNWLSAHHCGTLITYPMLAPNRRMERRSEIIDLLQNQYVVHQLVDFSYHEEDELFLEGTGSLVLDYVNHIAYAALSPRTHAELVQSFCEFLGYTPVLFNACDEHSRPIYHTNVLLFVGTEIAVLCTEAIRDTAERRLVLNRLFSTGHRVIDISLDQVSHFCGNLMELENARGEHFIVMSERAYSAFLPHQRALLKNTAKVLKTPLTTIEDVGGGSARCMLAGIFLPSL